MIRCYRVDNDGVMIENIMIVSGTGGRQRFDLRSSPYTTVTELRDAIWWVPEEFFAYASPLSRIS